MSLLLETVGVHVPTRNFRHFPLFTSAFSNRCCPSARCTSAANTGHKSIVRPVFGNRLVALSPILSKSVMALGALLVMLLNYIEYLIKMVILLCLLYLKVIFSVCISTVFVALMSLVSFLIV
jgi:hypothetical protein